MTKSHLPSERKRDRGRERKRKGEKESKRETCLTKSYLPSILQRPFPFPSRAAAAMTANTQTRGLVSAVKTKEKLSYLKLQLLPMSCNTRREQTPGLKLLVYEALSNLRALRY